VRSPCPGSRAHAPPAERRAEIEPRGLLVRRRAARARARAHASRSQYIVLTQINENLGQGGRCVPLPQARGPRSS
jgi:hypothetical protein